ncbi:hypothetical protein [Methylobacterium nigriterrae]|uniref:hypothetical protein n=1 Tax=Methylobacterium nigriterrae TaxID=3127512 RepID=UPI003013720F
MPEPDYDRDLKRLERRVGLVEAIAAERERLRTVLHRAQLFLDRTDSQPPASARLIWEWHRK